MPVRLTDYYQTLGVARSASTGEIRQAFRTLARQYHPEVAKDEKSAEKFQEINEIYDVLSDPAKRAKYDHLGVNWRQYAANSHMRQV